MDKQKIIEAIAKLSMAVRWKREEIKTNKVFFPKDDNKQLEEDIQVYETAIKALEKQIPKPIINREVIKDFNEKPLYICGNCPNCGCVRLRSTDTDYCVACGQKLNWQVHDEML